MVLRNNGETFSSVVLASPDGLIEDVAATGGLSEVEDIQHGDLDVELDLLSDEFLITGIDIDPVEVTQSLIVEAGDFHFIKVFTIFLDQGQVIESENVSP